MVSRFECDKVRSCSRCGGCCVIREDKNLKTMDDLQIRKKIFGDHGVLYSKPTWEYTINITQKEKKKLESLAKTKKVMISIKAKKRIFENNELVILDYYLDHDTCPFYNERKKSCLIYEDRPKICKDFPHTKPNQKHDYPKPNINFEEVLEKIENGSGEWI
ncbi:YkgJ family cysteine cluster protein [Candidatus Woesearchaeota archaeon]|nr:YkgJ family cysteine cluster protein [Candidatus Woesearchaeota archaeon]